MTRRTLLSLCGSLALAATAGAQLTYTTGLDVWLDASDIDGSGNSTLTDGDPVATWTNKGTTGVADAVAILTGGSGGTDGVFIAGGGDGPQDAVQLNNTRYQFGEEFMDSPNVTAYFVVQRTGGGQGALFNDYGVGSEVWLLNTNLNPAPGEVRNYFRDVDSDAIPNFTTGLVIDTWSTAFASMDSTTKTASFGLVGGTIATDTNPDYDPTTLDGDPQTGTVRKPTLFGFHDGNNTHDFNGFVSEVLIYDHVLDAAARATVEAYLISKTILPDADMDGISDAYELANTPDPGSTTALDPTLDDDNDGINNLQEYLGLDAADADHGYGQTRANLADTDDDGLDDDEEIGGTRNPYQPGAVEGETPTNAPGAPTNPNLADTDDDGILDGEEVEAGTNTFVTNPNLADTDADTLPDGWEADHGLDPADASTDNGDFGDPDMDGSENAAELANGTHPNNPDTDNDGYKDGEEDLFGEWLSATETGTDPLNPDSDGDGLKDGEENPDLAENDPANNKYKTDPNKYDSDLDGYGDGDEVTAGSDPAVNASFPAPAPGTAVQVDFHRSDGATGQEIQDGWAVWEFDSQVKPTSFNGTIGGVGITMTAGGTGGYLSSRGGPEDGRGGEITGTSWDDVVEDLLVARNGGIPMTLTIAFTGLGSAQTYTLTCFHNDPYTVGTNPGFAAGNGVITPSITTGTIVGTAQSGTCTNVRPGARTDDDLFESVVSFTTDVSGNATILLESTTEYVVVNGLDLAIALPGGELVITDTGFDGGDNFYIDVKGGVTGRKVTSSDDLDFTDEVDVTTTDDGSNRFFISPANRHAAKDFFRVKEAP